MAFSPCNRRSRDAADEHTHKQTRQNLSSYNTALILSLLHTHKHTQRAGPGCSAKGYVAERTSKSSPEISRCDSVYRRLRVWPQAHVFTCRSRTGGGQLQLLDAMREPDTFCCCFMEISIQCCDWFH